MEQDDDPEIDDAEYERVMALERGRDLANARLHESAHAQVARHYGLDAHVEIAPNAAGGFLVSHFIGKCRIQPTDDPYIKRMIGLAGTCAEALHKERDVTGSRLLNYLRREQISLSESDAVGAGVYTEQDIDACLVLLRALWPQIIAEALGRTDDIA